MSKKRKPHRKPPERKLRRGITKAAFVAIVICVAATGAAISRFEPVRRTLGLASVATPAPTPSANLTLAKEYIYADGRLIATEEATPSLAPSPTPSVSTPTNLIAVVEDAPSLSIDLMWSAPAGTVSHYLIERAERGGFTTLTSASPVPAFTDTTTQVDNVYRYRVRAVFSGGATSDYSNGDLATTFFQSEPVVAGQTVIRAKHFTDLRQAVDDARVIAGLGTASWSTPAPSIGGNIIGTHVAELRANLEPALAALGFPPTTYTDPAPLGGKPIQAAHINELRARVR